MFKTNRLDKIYSLPNNVYCKCKLICFIEIQQQYDLNIIIFIHPLIFIDDSIKKILYMFVNGN